MIFVRKAESKGEIEQEKFYENPPVAKSDEEIDTNSLGTEKEPETDHLVLRKLLLQLAGKFTTDEQHDAKEVKESNINEHQEEVVIIT